MDWLVVRLLVDKNKFSGMVMEESSGGFNYIVGESSILWGSKYMVRDSYIVWGIFFT